MTVVFARAFRPPSSFLPVGAGPSPSRRSAPSQGGNRVAEPEQVADEDRYAFDEHGIRRFIRAGDEVPKGWTVEQDEPQSAETEPVAKPRKVARKKTS
jgi:hypothetical protein